MYQNIEIEKLDHFGRGIAHLNNKIVFVKNALPEEIVDIEIIEDKKNYSLAKVLKYTKKREDRVEALCPYFSECGGCHLQFLPYSKTLQYKLEKVKELLQKNKISYEKDLEIIKNEEPFYYRNKLSLKILHGKIGFYEESTHKLVEINKCVIANPEINKVIKNYQMLNIKNGNLIIRCNSNKEILLIIESDEQEYEIELEKLKNVVKLVGIVYNEKTIYGDNFFYERISGMLFKVSYNSFFQVNPYICQKLFSLVSDNIEEGSKVLDLYSGVGTLSLVAGKKASEVMSVEIVHNAVLNGIFNAKLNKEKNIKFMLGDTSKTVDKIKNKFDTLIVDPPRKGLDKNTIQFIQLKKPEKIIYISCDASTLMRDLKYLEEFYEIKTYKILDMFSYSYHLESFVVLEKKERIK